MDFDNMDDFGGGGSSNDALGLELFMNNKVKESSSKYLNNGRNDDLDDITRLDESLNDYGNGSGTHYKPQSNLFSSVEQDDLGTINFDATDGIGNGEHHASFNEQPTFMSDNMDNNVGNTGSATWDNYNKFDNIPDNAAPPPQPRMSEDQIMRQKMKMINQISKWQSMYPMKLSKNYTINDNFNEIKAQYDLLEEEIERSTGIMFQKKNLLWGIHMLEVMNNDYKPFGDFDITGYSAELEEQIDEPHYDTVLDKLYTKYGKHLDTWPELKLALMLGGGMIMHSKRVARFKNAQVGYGPGAGVNQRVPIEAMNQYPDAASLMEQSMMNSMLNQASPLRQNPAQFEAVGGGGPGYMQQSGGMPHPPYLPSRNSGVPPAPMRTRDGDGGQPDITRGGNNRSSQSFAMRSPMEGGGGGGMRQEMQGPREVDAILSNIKLSRGTGGLGGSGMAIKTTTLNIPDNDSVMTYESMKKNGLNERNVNMPKRSRRPAATKSSSPSNDSHVIQIQ